METVQFNIYRKAAFAGALLQYNIYINGQFVGSIKNGKMLRVQFPKTEVYYLEDNNTLERNAVIYDNNSSEYTILLKRAGGWRTESYNEFYIDHGHRIDPLPSFHFEKFVNAIFENCIEQLPPNERLLALCLEFVSSITDDVQEVLSSSNLTNIIEALQKIGAIQYADLLLQIINEYFSDVVLPLSDEQIDQMYDRLNKANHFMLANEKTALDQFHKALVRYIISNLNNTENIY